MSWENWIIRNDEDGPVTTYDFLLDLAVINYKLADKNRKIQKIDMKHFLVSWWNKNKGKFKKYKSMESLGSSMGITHCTVVHYVKHRKKSLKYEDNTKCINDFLNS